MTTKPRIVVGDVIVDGGRVLAARRTRPSDVAGYWEFPGGKVEEGEDPREALVREIREELSASVAIVQELRTAGTPWPISEKYVLRLYLASVVRGDPRPGDDHDRLCWLAVEDLESVEWLASDRLALPTVRGTLRPNNP